MTRGNLPRIPYGAVYLRKSNPPREDWARDYRTAAEDGMNTFRHWFLWSAIEVAPGEYDWADYDRQLDLAAEHGIKTIIAEMITAAPEWAYRVYADARLETRAGRKVESSIGASTAVGGFPGLCLDNAEYRAAAERFLRALAARYRGHPGLGGYDIWNECGYGADTCYCPTSAEAFRAWLRDKYGDLRALGEAWRRYSVAEWEDVTPPRALGPYPQTLDWLEFRLDNAYGHMRWRRDVLASVDPDHPITAHGVAGTINGAAPRGTDDWRAAAVPESYGFTWVACRKGDELWKQMHAVDLVRGASRGKPFWHAEAQGGPLWMQPQVIGRPRDDGRIPRPEDIRFWNLLSLMGGATGILYPRWRPLLDGPLWGAFGAYGMNGSRTSRSEMASRVARWANAPEQAALWRSRPIRGDVGILYVPETQRFVYAQQESTDAYAESAWGAYQGFLDAGIQADWVHVDDLADEEGGAARVPRALYLPFPVMLTQATADRLRAWVERGGALVCEGCPGYWGDRGHVGTTQPNLGLDALFGAREAYVEFTPDLLGDLRFRVGRTPVWGGLYLQAYEPTTGTPAGWYDDGRVAAVEHAHGRGRTLLLGTMAGAGYAAHPGDREPSFFREALAWAGVQQAVWTSEPRVIARLHEGEGGAYLWVANPARQALPVRVRLAGESAALRPTRSLWGAEARTEGEEIALTAGPRDVAVIALE